MTNDVGPDDYDAFLDLSWERAKDEANTLREQLRLDRFEITKLISKGSVLSTGKNSAHLTLARFNPGDLTQRQITGIYSKLLGLYDQLKTQITLLIEEHEEFPDGVPAGFDFDEPIRELMIRVFRTQSSGIGVQLPDIRQLRWPLYPPPVSQTLGV